MSLGHGAKIVTDGLVFAYDMGSKRSWKGKPGTNVAYHSGEKRWFTGDLTTTGISTTAKPELGIEHYYISCTTKGSFRIFFDLSQLVNGATYTMSFKYRLISATSFEISDWCDTSVTKTTTDYGKYMLATATGTRATYDSTYRFMDLLIGEDGGTVEIWDVQLEEGSSATEFYIGTRSNTEAILDWTGNTTLTLTNPVYNSDNTFSFDGSSREIESSTTTLPQSDYVTVEVVAKRTGSTNVGFIVGNGTTGLNGYWMGWDSSNFIFSVGVGTAGEQLRPGGLPVDTTHHLVGTYDGTTMRMYVDGEEFSNYSGEFTGPIDYSGVPANFKIGAINGAGQQPDRYFNGYIYQVKIYSRALSANEVKNNFNAIRGRYGL